jgi:cell division protein FtsI/penicillin-binding protein 2
MIDFTKDTVQGNQSRRISLFIVLFTILLLVIYVKLFNIQVINNSRYQLAAKKQYESRISLKPSRGIIFDRKLNPLVTNENCYSFGADPNMIDNKDSVALLFSKVFGKDENYYLDKLNTNNTSFVWLERRVDKDYESKLHDLNLSGVIKINEPQRTFNFNSLASQIIGSTDIDNNGITGAELECNEQLSGKDGYVVMQKDGLGRKRPALEYPREEPQNGNNIVLTIDLNVQKIIEEELQNGVNANDADGGKCIVMQVKTGEILGVYSYTNPQGGEGNEQVRFNKLSFLTDLYEPGSTFKIVSAAASLEEGIESKYDVIQTYGGEYNFDGLKIADSHKFTSLSFQEVVEQSSNIGMMQVAYRLGKERFYKYARDFGFGITSGIDLPGEMKGSLKRPVEFTPVSLNFMAIGYEVMVTAMQMANAYACVANGGILMKPYVVKKILAPNGSLIKENLLTPVRTVISQNTAKSLTELLYGVVERGTGREAHLDNMKIAGKTGTSQKVVEGEYSKRNFTSSFIGYFPAENPGIVVAVIIDNPKSGEYYGGKVAAPIFKRIAERIISTNDVMDYTEPKHHEEAASEVKLTGNNETSVQDAGMEYINLTDFEINDAVKLLKENNIDYEISGPKKNSVVTDQKITIDENNHRIKNIVLITGLTSKVVKDTPPVMPDLKGLSVRKSIKIISSMGADFKVNGHGKVVDTQPDAGSMLNKNQQIVINCVESKE